MSRKAVIVTPFAQNCWILAGDSSKNAVVVDPGGDCDLILAEVAKLGLHCSQIWLTHSHLDHCGGVKKLKAATGASLYASAEEAYLRENVTTFGRMFGIHDGSLENCPEPDVVLKGGETLRLSEYGFQVMDTPGHSPGGLSFYCKEAGVVLVGDLLFAGSIGRTDLPGGDHGTLMASIEQLMDKLPPQTIVLSGHGPETTLETERSTNPFLQEWAL